MELGEMAKYEQTEKLNKMLESDTINELPQIARLFYFLEKSKQKIKRISSYPKLRKNQITRISKLVKNSTVLKQSYKGFWFIQKEDGLKIEFAKYKNRRFNFNC